MPQPQIRADLVSVPACLSRSLSYTNISFHLSSLELVRNEVPGLHVVAADKFLIVFCNSLYSSKDIALETRSIRMLYSARFVQVRFVQV